MASKKKILVVLWLAFSFKSIKAFDPWVPLTLSMPDANILYQNIPLPLTRDSEQAVGTSMEPGFAPGISIGFGREKRIYAVEDTVDKGSNLRDLSQISGSEIFLHPNNPKGYQVIYKNNKRLALGGGISAGPGGFLCLRVGLKLGLSVEKNFTYLRHVKTMKEANAVGSIFNPSIPLDIENINKFLQPNDKLIFKRKGGLFFDVFVATGVVLKAGLSGSIKSSWEVKLKRLANNNSEGPLISLTYTRGKEKSIGIDLSNLLLNIGLAKIWDNSKKFKFHFDLGNKNIVPEETILTITKGDNRLKEILKKHTKLKSFLKKTNANILKDTEGAYEIDLKGMTTLLAYQLAIEGDLSVAMRLAREDMKYGIKMIKEESEIKRQVNKNISFSIPIIYSASKEKSDVFIFNDMKRISDNHTIYTHSGIISNHYLTSGVLSSSIKRSKIYTTILSEEEKGSKDSPVVYNLPQLDITGQLLLHVEKNGTTPKTAIKELKKFRDIVGYKKFYDPLIEKIKDIGERSNIKLKTFSANLSIVFSEIALESLIDLLTDEKRDLVKEANDYLDGFLNKYSSIDYKTGESFNSDKLKGKIKFTSVAKKELCQETLAQNLSLCVRVIKNQIKSSLSEAIRLAKSIDKSRIPKEFHSIIRDDRWNSRVSLGVNELIKSTDKKNNKQLKSEDIYSKFVEDFSKLGYKLSSNRFVLKTILRGLKYSCPRSDYLTLKKHDLEEQKCPPKTIYSFGKKIKIPFIIKTSIKSSQLPHTEIILYGKEFIQ